MFKKRYSKWYPLGYYTIVGGDYITFARKNLKTGMLHFKTKSVNTKIFNISNPILKEGLICVEKQWKIISEL